MAKNGPAIELVMTLVKKADFLNELTRSTIAAKKGWPHIHM